MASSLVQEPSQQDMPKAPIHPIVQVSLLTPGAQFRALVPGLGDSEDFYHPSVGCQQQVKGRHPLPLNVTECCYSDLPGGLNCYTFISKREK